jgi:hypothetical protein
MDVDTVALKKVGGFYEIYYWHSGEETLVDRSDDEVGHEYDTWADAARQHARDMEAVFLDLT